MAGAKKRNSVTRLDTDPRSFDVRVVAAVLDFVNHHNHTATFSAGKIALNARGGHVFGWMPDALAARARAAGIQEDLTHWRGDTPAEEMLAFVYLSLWLGKSYGGFNWFGRQVTAEQWIDTLLAPLPIYTRMRFIAGKVQRVEVPLLTTIQRCAAYAMAVVLEDRWDIRNRIRRCPFSRPGEHFFLDYRLDRAGNFMPGAQEYCCPAHSNAHRQQRFRDEQKAQRAPRRHK